MVIELNKKKSSDVEKKKVKKIENAETINIEMRQLSVFIKADIFNKFKYECSRRKNIRTLKKGISILLLIASLDNFDILDKFPE